MRITLPPNSIYRVSVIHSKSPMEFFTDIELKKKKITMHIETQKIPNSQSKRSLEKEEWSWRNQTSWLQTILQSYSYQDSMVVAQKKEHRPMEQHKKFRDKSMHLGYLIFDKGGKNIQRRKDSLFKCCWENWSTICRRMKLEHFLTPHNNKLKMD